MSYFNPVAFAQQSTLNKQQQIAFLQTALKAFDEDGGLRSNFCVNNVNLEMDEPVLLGYRGIDFSEVKDEKVKASLLEFFVSMAVDPESIPDKFDGCFGEYIPSDDDEVIVSKSGDKILVPANFKIIPDDDGNLFVEGAYRRSHRQKVESVETLDVKDYLRSLGVEL